MGQIAKNATLRISANIQNVFIFCETEIAGINDITTFATHSIKNYNLTDIEEFLLMSKFPNLVIANSTYSFWAAIATTNR